jgi:hypothetical protein
MDNALHQVDTARTKADKKNKPTKSPERKKKKPTKGPDEKREAARLRKERQRSKQSVDKRLKEVEAERIRIKGKRANLSSEQKLKEIEAGKIRIKGKRANLSSEQRLKEVEAARVGMRSTRANLSSEQSLKEVEAARVGMRSMRVEMKKEKKDFLVDFSTTKLTKQSHFEAFEQNEEVACMLWHINSGFHRFSQLEDLQGEGGKEAMRSLLDEIHSEKLDPDKKNAMMEAFLQAQGRGGYAGDCSPFENSNDIN